MSLAEASHESERAKPAIALASRFTRVLGLTVLGAAASFATSWSAARWLGVELFGLFAFACSAITLAAMLAPLGAQMAALKYVAQYRASGEWGLLVGFLRRARFIAFGVAVLLGAIGVWCSRIVPEHDALPATVLLLAFAAVPFMAVARVSISSLRAFDKTAFAVGGDTLLRESVVVAALGAAVGFGVKPDAGAAVALASFGVLISSAFLLHRERQAIIAEAPTAVEAVIDPRWISSCLILLFVTFSQLALKRMDVLIIGSILGAEHAGPYAVALRLAEALQLPLTAGSMLIATRIAVLHAKGDIVALQEAVTRVVRPTFAITLACAAPLLLAPRFFLGLFGPDFESADSILRLLVLGQLVNVATGFAGGLLTMTGHERVAALVIGAFGSTNLLLNAGLVWLMGPVGAAVGSMTAIAGSNMVLMYVAWRRTGVNSAVR
jgi:O-antigen/teichoic acid export membrane protein